MNGQIPPGAYVAGGGPGRTDRPPYREAEGRMTAAQARFRRPEVFIVSAAGSGRDGDAR